MIYLRKIVLVLFLLPFFSSAMGCENEIAIFKRHINLSSCQLGEAIEARAEKSLRDIQVTYFRAFKEDSHFPAFGELFFTAIYNGPTTELQDTEVRFTCHDFFLSAAYDLFLTCESERLKLPLLSIPVEREWNIDEVLGEIEIFNHHIDLSGHQLAAAIEEEKPYLKDVKIVHFSYQFKTNANMVTLPADGNIIFTAMFKKRRVIRSCKNVSLYRSEPYNNDLILIMSCSEGLMSSSYQPLLIFINLSSSLNIDRTHEEIRTEQEIVRPVKKELLQVNEPQAKSRQVAVPMPPSEQALAPSLERIPVSHQEEQVPVKQELVPVHHQAERTSHSPLSVPFILMRNLMNKIGSIFRNI